MTAHKPSDQVITRAKTHLRRLLPKNAFARGVSVLVGGTAGAELSPAPGRGLMYEQVAGQSAGTPRLGRSALTLRSSSIRR